MAPGARSQQAIESERRPAVTTNEVRIRDAIEYLRAARDLFNAAGAPKTTARVRAALSSAYGAQRHAQMEPYRTERQSNKRRDKCAVCGKPATRGNEFGATCDDCNVVPDDTPTCVHCHAIVPHEDHAPNCPDRNNGPAVDDTCDDCGQRHNLNDGCE